MLLCIECSETFKSRRELQQHQQRVHQFRHADSDSDGAAGEGEDYHHRLCTTVAEAALQHHEDPAAHGRRQQQHRRGKVATEAHEAGSPNLGQPSVLLRRGAKPSTDPVIQAAGEGDAPGAPSQLAARSGTGRGRSPRPGTAPNAAPGLHAGQQSRAGRPASAHLPDSSSISDGPGDWADEQPEAHGRGRTRLGGRHPSAAARNENAGAKGAAAGDSAPRQLLRRPQSVTTHDNHSVPGPTVGTVSSAQAQHQTSGSSVQAAALPVVLPVADAAAAATAAILGLMSLRDKPRPGNNETSVAAGDSVQAGGNSQASSHGTRHRERPVDRSRQQQDAEAGTVLDAGDTIQRDAAASGVDAEDRRTAKQAQGRARRQANGRATGGASQASSGTGAAAAAGHASADGKTAALLEGDEGAAAAGQAEEAGMASGKPGIAGRSNRGKRQGAAAVESVIPIEVDAEAAARAVANALMRPSACTVQPSAVGGVTLEQGAGDRKPSRRPARATDRMDRPSRGPRRTQQGSEERPSEGIARREVTGEAEAADGEVEPGTAASAATTERAQLNGKQQQQRGRGAAASISFFTCPACSSHFYSPVVLRHHMRNEHPDVVLSDAEVKRSSISAAPAPAREARSAAEAAAAPAGTSDAVASGGPP